MHADLKILNFFFSPFSNSTTTTRRPRDFFFFPVRKSKERKRGRRRVLSKSSLRRWRKFRSNSAAICAFTRLMILPLTLWLDVDTSFVWKMRWNGSRTTSNVRSARKYWTGGGGNRMEMRRGKRKFHFQNALLVAYAAISIKWMSPLITPYRRRSVRVMRQCALCISFKSYMHIGRSKMMLSWPVMRFGLHDWQKITSDMAPYRTHTQEPRLKASWDHRWWQRDGPMGNLAY